MLFNPRCFNPRVFNVGDEIRGHGKGRIKRRRHRYQYRDVQEALTIQEQSALEERAAQIALEELERDKRRAQLEKRKLALAEIKKRIDELHAQSEWLARQAEILRDLISLQKKRQEKFLEDEEDIATLLLLM